MTRMKCFDCGAIDTKQQFRFHSSRYFCQDCYKNRIKGQATKGVSVVPAPSSNKISN